MFRTRQNQIFGSKSGSEYFPEKYITDLPQCAVQAEIFDPYSNGPFKVVEKTFYRSN